MYVCTFKECNDYHDVSMLVRPACCPLITSVAFALLVFSHVCLALLLLLIPVMLLLLLLVVVLLVLLVLVLMVMAVVAVVVVVWWWCASYARVVW